MKCEDLKELLNSRDERNKTTRENTIECFNLIKDFVIDDFIKQSIDSNFCKDGHYIDGVKIYRKLFEIKGVDSQNVRSWGLTMDWQDELRFIDPTTRIYLEGDQKTGFEEAVDAMREVFEYFDRELFKNLVENHLRSHGFRKVKTENFRGNMVETKRFYASRSTIEKICCPDAKTSQTDVDEEKNSGVIFAVVIMVMVLIAASFIIF